MSEAIFVSDLHLGEREEHRYVLFLSFVEKLLLDPPKRFVMLGDIFDLWVGDHSYFVEKHKDLIGKLCSLRDSGCELHYFEGNHDLYLKQYFGEELGFIIHPNSYVANWANTEIRMEHGDLANPDDKGYLFLRKFLRNFLVRFSLENLPSKFIVALGDKASKASRSYTDRLDDDSVEVIRNYAENLSKENSFSVLITGHTHQLDDYEFENSGRKVRSINLGSWFSKKISYLNLDEDSNFSFIEL